MKRFKVRVREVHYYDIEVEAETPNQARQVAYEIDRDAKRLPELRYEYTMDVEKWRVEDEKGSIEI